MFFKREKQSLSNISIEIYDKLIDPESELSLIKKEFDFSFIYDEIQKNYCLDDGRNCLDGVIALRAIFLQKYFGLSERMLENKSKFDIQIKHFLDINIDETVFDFTTIWKFKKMLGKDEVDFIFNNIISQIKSKGIIKYFRRQAIDTIPIIAAAGLPSTTCLIYQAINKVCKSLDDKMLAIVLEEMDLTLEKLENNRKVHPLFKSEQENKIKAFQNAAKCGYILLNFAEKYQLKSENIDLLKEILQENTEQKKEEEYHEKHTPHAKKSLVDKDAGFGHKTEDITIFGYKAGVSVVPEGIITAYEVTSMSHRDDEHLIPILKMQEKNGTKCEEVDADSAYGFILNYLDAEKLNVILHSPLRDFDPEKMSVYDFKHNPATNELTCINLVTAKGKNSGGLSFEFPLKTCRACPKADQCPLSPSKRVSLHTNHEIARKAIARQRNDRELDKQNREKGIKNFKRLVVENVFAFLEKLGIKTTPAYSLKMTKVHVGLTATLSNMIKTVRLLRKKQRALDALIV